jgi:hypothetical protein
VEKLKILLDRDSKLKKFNGPELGAQKVEKHCYKGCSKRQDAQNKVFNQVS